MVMRFIFAAKLPRFCRCYAAVAAIWRQVYFLNEFKKWSESRVQRFMDGWDLSVGCFGEGGCQGVLGLVFEFV